MDAEELEIGDLHPFLRFCIGMLARPFFASATPGVWARSVHFGAPEKTYLLAGVDRTADVDARNREILDSVFCTCNLLRRHFVPPSL